MYCELSIMKLSLVVPCYNEAENVQAFQDAVIDAFEGCGYDFEIVFVDDGSKDATFHNLKKLHAAQACPVKVVSFSRNFGKEAAIYAEKVNITEELVRLKSHIRQFDKTLHSTESVGRKLDFIVQEINRETNTIASKVNNFGIASIVIEIKSEIEKIREQIQNVE